jgi:tRNA A37 threonylcarbamoyladenosine modification protein TsaB
VTILGFDTSTAASSAALLGSDGELFEVRAAPSRLLERPAHATELLPAIGEVM